MPKIYNIHDAIALTIKSKSFQGQESLEKEAKGNPGRLITVPLDVTKDDSVKAAAETVKKLLPSDESMF